MSHSSDPQLPLDKNQEPEATQPQAESTTPKLIGSKMAKKNVGIHERLQHIGREFVDICHYIILFLISVVVVWTAGKEFVGIVQKGSADLKDILMLFIYLELLAMIGIYFKTHRLPVQFLIFIAITALSRHLVVDVQAVSDYFHLWLLATISVAIMALSASIVVLTWTARTFGRPEDNLDSQHAEYRIKSLLPDNAEAPDNSTKHRRE
ncbi:phosphate-starvation-inducible protein PsiE [Psychrobacter sp. LV10R520-6]|uniref:phosphate-starvation-inducible protein PsiE n=1 Tax=Psychrobacter sp. LV10R520-6 TaxID=1415574 RepID=UPI0024CBA290|nr:phosphate-starvation-inducible PsiE family protein [Psychrobacter sp. LV10R520-6]SNT69334.1 Phosphate starvation-inducible membrane PsiE [Psychrobacter sp. LV10R520-6]